MFRSLLDPVIRSVALLRARTGLGDLLCTVPALRALKQARPDLHVALITYPEMAEVVDRMSPWVDELVPFPGWPGIPERPVDAERLKPWLREMRDRSWDLALQAYGARTAANEVTERLGAAYTGGFFVPGEVPKPDLALSVPYPHHLHEVDRHLHLLGHLGVPGGDRRLEFPIGPRDEGHGRAPGSYAVLHPGATSSSRRWPVERFAQVGDALRRDGLTVLVTGVPGEEEVARAVVGAMDEPAEDLCGSTSLGSFAALLRDAAVLVGNDTGSAHLAAAVGCPSVTAFLSGDPVRWAGHGPRHAVARVQVECNPCPHLDCPIDHRCSARLTAEEVLSASRRVVGGHG